MADLSRRTTPIASMPTAAGVHGWAARRRKPNRFALIRDALREHLRRVEIRELEERGRKGNQIGPRADEKLSAPGGRHEGPLRNQSAQRGYGIRAAHREARGTARSAADAGFTQDRSEPDSCRRMEWKEPHGLLVEL